MVQDSSPESRMDRLSLVIYDGHYDKVHYALAMASSAAALEIPVTLFFTMNACRALMVSADDGRPLWRTMPLSESDGTGGDMDDEFRAQKIGAFEELLGACMDLGVTFMVCEMGLKARNLPADDLREDVPIKPGGLVTFLSGGAKDGSIVFI